MPAGIIMIKPDGGLTFEYSLVGGVNDHTEGCQGTGRAFERA